MFPHKPTVCNISLEISFNVEKFDEEDQIDFKKSSRSRQHSIFCNGMTFYVNYEKIAEKSFKLAEELKYFVDSDGVKHYSGILKGIPSIYFESLLRLLCPSSCGLYEGSVTGETVEGLLLLAERFEIPSVHQSCVEFVTGNGVEEMTVKQLLSLYKILMEKEEEENLLMLTCLISALLNHEDQSSVFTVFQSSHPASSILKNAFRRLHELKHQAEFVNATTFFRCPCKKSTNRMRLYERKRIEAPSACGLFCSSCQMAVCSNCKEKSCPGRILDILTAPLKTEVLSTPSIPVKSTFSPPELFEQQESLVVSQSPPIYHQVVYFAPPPQSTVLVPVMVMPNIILNIIEFLHRD